MNERAGDLDGDEKAARPTGEAPSVKIFGRRVPMPRSRILRIVLGVLFTIFGLFGFLPILGYWMVPFGLLILSYEFASIRRARRKGIVWWGRRRNGRPGP